MELTLSTHVVVDVDASLPVGEVGNLGVGDADLEGARDLLSERDVRISANNPDLIIQGLIEVHEALRRALVGSVAVSEQVVLLPLVGHLRGLIDARRPGRRHRGRVCVCAAVVVGQRARFSLHRG